MSRKFFVTVIATILLGVSFITNGYAQSTPAVCTNPANEDIKKACAEFAAEAAELAKLQAQLNEQKNKTGVLQKDVNALVSQIKNTQTKISNQISTIGRLSQEIVKKEEAINSLESELDREKASLEQLIKRTNELDQKGAAYVLFSANSVSEFYQDFDDFLSIKASLYDSLTHVKKIKNLTEKEREALRDKQSQAVDAKNALESEKGKLSESQKQAQIVLNTSKTEEQRKAALVAEQQKKVAEIQSRLFTFAGGATKAIPFKDAYAYALEAQKVTGVRAAFVLATLTQESNLGANVGTCNRAGDPPEKSFRVQMPGPADKAAGRSGRDDQTLFIQITTALGLNPETTPISCRIASVGGWGGAMGPAQFIPSTWVSYAPRVAAALGKATANPWIARDAIMASSMLHRANGAASNEREAACRYYSGRACATSAAIASYGNSVAALTRTLQADIDYLETYGVSRR